MRCRVAEGSRRGWRRVAGIAGALALVSAAGCGVAAEREPEPVTPSPPGSATPVGPHTTGVVQVYLVRDGHLVPVPRAGWSVADAVSALTEGPTALDVDAELDSSLPDGPVGLVPEQDPDVVVIAVPPAFAALPERHRYLAAAQLVWTATDVCCAQQVRIVRSDRSLTLPTDTETTARPLRRTDYEAAAPP
jgi:Sporulation and spore germination